MNATGSCGLGGRDTRQSSYQALSPSWRATFRLSHRALPREPHFFPSTKCWTPCPSLGPLSDVYACKVDQHSIRRQAETEASSRRERVSIFGRVSGPLHNDGFALHSDSAHAVSFFAQPSLNPHWLMRNPVGLRARQLLCGEPGLGCTRFTPILSSSPEGTSWVGLPLTAPHVQFPPFRRWLTGLHQHANIHRIRGMSEMA